MIIVICTLAGAVARIAVEYIIGKPTVPVEFTDPVHKEEPIRPDMSAGGASPGGAGRASLPKSLSPIVPASEVDGAQGADPSKATSGALAASSSDREMVRTSSRWSEIKGVYEELGMRPEYERAFGPQWICPLGISAVELDRSVRENPASGYQVEEFESAYWRLSESNQRVPAVLQLGASFLEFQLLAFRSHGRLECIAGVDSGMSQMTVEALARWYTQEAGRRFERLSGEEQKSALAGAAALYDGMWSAKREAWKMTWGAWESSGKASPLDDEVSGFVVSKGKAYIFRRGTDPELERMLGEWEAADAELQERLRAILTR